MLAGLASIPTWVRSRARARKLGQVNPGAYAIAYAPGFMNSHWILTVVYLYEIQVYKQTSYNWCTSQGLIS